MHILAKLTLGVTLLAVPPVYADHIDDALARNDRNPGEVTRDVKRKPGKFLRLLGIEPGMHVADIVGAGGYYTDILSAAVGEKGKVLLYNNFYLRGRFIDAFGPGGVLDQRHQTAKWQTNVTVDYGDLDAPKYPESLDAAIMVLFYHDTVWQGTDRAQMNKAIFDSLKPGGVFGIIDHSGEAGSGVRDVKTLHRIEEQTVVDEVLAAGFKLVVSADFLRNPDDTRDYNVFRDFSTNRDSTDRFVLKFVKPKE